MVASGNGDRVLDMIWETVQITEEKVDKLVESHAEQCATVRGHGAAIKWLFTIVGTITAGAVIYGVIR